MKLRLLLLFFLLLNFQNLSAQWIQTNGPEGCIPNCFARTNSTILCGSLNGIYYSTDEGVSWQDYPFFSNYNVNSILTFSDTIIVSYSKYSDNINYYYDSVFCQTSFDLGQSWTSKKLIGTYGFTNLILHSFGNYIIGENSDEMFKSYDFGLTWLTVNIPFPYYQHSFSFTKKYLLTTTGFDSYICDTSLIFQKFDLSNSIINKCIIDSLLFGNKNFAPGKFELVSSKDFGQTWDSIIVIDSSFNFQFGVYDKTLYYTYPYGQYYLSTDYGVTWMPSQMPYQLKFSNRFPLLSGDEIVVANLHILHYDKNNDSAYISEKGIRGRDINFIKGSMGKLYCYDYSNLYLSSDEGLTWGEKGYAPFAPWVDNNNVIVSGDSLFSLSIELYSSFNEGITWSSNSTPGSCRNIAKKNSRIYISWWDVSLYTDDFGANWYFLPDLPSESACYDNYLNGGNMCVLNNNLFSITDEGNVYKLDEADTSWSYSFCFPLDIFSIINDPEIKVVDNNLIVTCDSAMFISYDGGINWTYPALNGIPIDGNGEKICPSSIVGENGDLLGICKNQIYISSNGGDDWIKFSTQAVNFAPTGLEIMNHKLFAGSENKSVWTNSIILGLHENNFNEKIRLKIFPNPSDDFINISMENFQPGNYYLSIFNCVGKEIQKMKINSEKITIDVRNFSEGIYFGNIVSASGNKSEGFKFTVIR